MAIVIHTIHGDRYAYDHKRAGDRVVATYLHPVGAGGRKRPLRQEHPGAKQAIRFKQHEASKVIAVPERKSTQHYSIEGLDAEGLLKSSESMTGLDEIKAVAEKLSRGVSLGNVTTFELYKDANGANGAYTGGHVMVEPLLDLNNTYTWIPAPAGKDPIMDGHFLQSVRKVPQMVETAIHEGLHARFAANTVKGHELIKSMKDLNYGGDEFEGLMTLGTFFIVAPEELKKESETMYNVAKGWFDPGVVSLSMPPVINAGYRGITDLVVKPLPAHSQDLDAAYNMETHIIHLGINMEWGDTIETFWHEVIHKILHESEDIPAEAISKWDNIADDVKEAAGISWLANIEPGKSTQHTESKPLDLPVMYHGSPVSGLTELKEGAGGEYQRVAGIYLTKNKHEAEKYTKKNGKRQPDNVYSVQVDIKNPAPRSVLESLGLGGNGIDRKNELIKLGYDGVIDELMGEVIAFFPEQVTILPVLDALI